MTFEMTQAVLTPLVSPMGQYVINGVWRKEFQIKDVNYMKEKVTLVAKTFDVSMEEVCEMDNDEIFDLYCGIRYPSLRIG